MDTITAKGVNGTISFDGDAITIERPWVTSWQGRSTKHIPLDAVQAVQYSPAKRLGPVPALRGYIAFTVAGGIEKQAKLHVQTMQAFNDENAVVIYPTRRQVAQFDALYAAVTAARQS